MRMPYDLVSVSVLLHYLALNHEDKDRYFRSVVKIWMRCTRNRKGLN